MIFKCTAMDARGREWRGKCRHHHGVEEWHKSENEKHEALAAAKKQKAAPKAKAAT